MRLSDTSCPQRERPGQTSQYYCIVFSKNTDIKFKSAATQKRVSSQFAYYPPISIRKFEKYKLESKTEISIKNTTHENI